MNVRRGTKADFATQNPFQNQNTPFDAAPSARPNARPRPPTVKPKFHSGIHWKKVCLFIHAAAPMGASYNWNVPRPPAIAGL